MITFRLNKQIKALNLAITLFLILQRDERRKLTKFSGKSATYFRNGVNRPWK